MKTIFLTLCLLTFINHSNAQDYRFGKVSDEEIQQKTHPTDSSADAAILYREMKTDFNYSRDNGWYLVTDYFERIKIYTKDGAKYANKTVDLYQDKNSEVLKKLKAFTYNSKSNGKTNKVKLQSGGIIKEEITRFLNQTKITMPDVQPGSVIEIRYTVESPFVMNIDEYRFQEKIPVDKLHMRFSAPETFQFKTYHRGQLPINVETTTGQKSITVMVSERKVDKNTLGTAHARKVTKPKKVDMENNIYTVDMNDIPAIKEEPYVGNIENYMSGLQFELGSTRTDSGLKFYSVTWDDVSKTIYQSSEFGTELGRNRYFRKVLDDLLKGVSNPTKKTEIIYAYIQEKMNWNNYNGFFTRDGIRKAYKENTGNAAEINLMLTAMLYYAQVKAYPVLVSTKAHGIPLFPTINGFNYVITAVELPQGMFLLDATNKNATIGVLGSKLMNWNGRIIYGEDHSDWISLSSVIPAVRQTLLNVEVNQDLEVSGNANQRLSGNYALNYRNNFKNKAPSERKKEVDKLYNGADLSEVSFENLENSMEAVSLAYNFETIEGIEEVAGKIFMSPLFYLQNKENPFKSETRKYPIDFGYPYHTQTIMNFKIPKDFEVETLPENAMSTLGDMGSYKYLISQNGDIIQLSVELKINQPFIAESDYNDLKQFFALLVEKENEKIVFNRVSE